MHESTPGENRSLPVVLVEMLEKCGQTGMRLHEIYAQIEAHYPESIAGKEDWKGYLRRKLCIYPCFVRIYDSEDTDLQIWCLNRDNGCSLVPSEEQKSALSAADLLSLRKTPAPTRRPKDKPPAESSTKPLENTQPTTEEPTLFVTKPITWSHAAAIVQILQSSKRRGMWFHEICAQFEADYPDLVVRKPLWRTNIACTLKRTPCFTSVKDPFDSNRFWRLVSKVYLVRDREGKVMISITRPFGGRVAEIRPITVWSLKAILVKILEGYEPPGLSVPDIYVQVEVRYPESIVGRNDWRNEVESILANTSAFICTMSMPAVLCWSLNPAVKFFYCERKNGYGTVYFAGTRENESVCHHSSIMPGQSVVYHEQTVYMEYHLPLHSLPPVPSPLLNPNQQQLAMPDMQHPEVQECYPVSYGNQAGAQECYSVPPAVQELHPTYEMQPEVSELYPTYDMQPQMQDCHPTYEIQPKAPEHYATYDIQPEIQEHHPTYEIHQEGCQCIECQLQSPLFDPFAM